MIKDVVYDVIFILNLTCSWEIFHRNIIYDVLF
jgi:hypothetical protein